MTQEPTRPRPEVATTGPETSAGIDRAPVAGPPPAPVIGAVLMGGRSRRFGSDKALADTGGRPLASRVIEALRDAGADPVVAVGGSAGHDLGLPTIPDQRPGEGPLAALATVLVWARRGVVVVAPCDLPLLAPAHIAALVAAAGPDRAAVATVDGVPQPSVGCWPATFGGAVQAAVERGERSWRAALEVVAWVGVPLPADALADADTPDALASLLLDSGLSMAVDRPGANHAPTVHRLNGVPVVVTTDRELEEVVEAATMADRYAIDTEFHRERTYYPQVALIQLAWHDEVVLIDPLPLDLTPLARLLDSAGVCVVHAGVQDLEVLDLATGTMPRNLFDTQIAAGFLGLSNGSLKALLDRYLDVSVPKGDRLTDWLRRPLSDDQLRYAAADVEHLIPLANRLQSELEATGRLEWAHEECALVRTKPRNRRLPEDAILRIKEARALRGPSFRVATAIGAWRERRAAEADVPVRQILPDLGIVAIAQQAPTSVQELQGLRGVEPRHLRNGADQEIIAAVQVGLRMQPDEERAPRPPELPRHLRPVVTLVTAWISQLARDHNLDPALLATRADIESLLKGDPDSRLHHGWRSEMVGTPIAQLVAGDAAVAFDGDGQLVLEARSRRPL